jgi:hypothetical protein
VTPLMNVELICDVVLGCCYLTWLGSDILHVEALPLLVTHTPHVPVKHLERTSVLDAPFTPITNLSIGKFIGEISETTLTEDGLKRFGDRVKVLRECLVKLVEASNQAKQRYTPLLSS